MYKIAIIEDVEDSRDLLYYLLRDEFNVHCYSKGEDALRHFVDEPPDLVILDILLPGIDGTEVLTRLRGHHKLAGVPVLALTANAMSGDREKYLASGFNGYVSKPIVDIDEFLDTLRRLLNTNY